MPIGIVNFPGSADTLSTLIRAVSEGASTLSGSHSNAVTTITCASVSLAPADGVAVITNGTDFECITFTGKGSGTLTGVVRGVDGTTARTWPNGTSIFFDADPAMKHNVLAAVALALETKVGTGASTPLANLALLGTGSGTSAWKQQGLTLLDTDSFSAVTEVIRDGVFSTAYDDYLILVDITSSGTTTSIHHRMQMRVGGVTANGAADYAWNRHGVVAGTVAGQSDSGDPSMVVAVNMTNHIAMSVRCEVFSPFLTGPTKTIGQSMSTGGGHMTNQHGGYHSLSNSYDGFRYFPDSSTITGRIRTYGYGKTP